MIQGHYFIKQVIYVTSCRLVYPVNAAQAVDLPHTRREVENDRLLVRQNK